MLTLKQSSQPGKMAAAVLLLFFLLCFSFSATAEVPKLSARVNDFASMLSKDTKASLENELLTLEQSDSTQIVVVTIPSLEGASIEEYSLKLAEAWKIGQQNIDNGAILLVSKEDRKIRIEVGYGLEGELTDLISGRIINTIITPEFKKGNYDLGISKGVGTMISVVKGTYNEKLGGDENDVDFGGFIGLMFFLFVFLDRVATKNRIVSGMIGAIITPLMGAIFIGEGIVLLICLSIIGGVVGILLGSLFSVPKGQQDGIKSGHSGWYIGGGSSGSSGGFGGFSGGGGGFGGGGASGGW